METKLVKSKLVPGLLFTVRTPGMHHYENYPFPLTVQCTQARNYDIYFAIDSSLSITSRNFRRVRAFLYSFISLMEIGPDKNHIGLIQFSEEHLTRTEYSFSDLQEKAAILQTLKDMRYQNGRSTFTGSALKIIMDSVRFSPSIFASFCFKGL